jgi:hypothetical protein
MKGPLVNRSRAVTKPAKTHLLYFKSEIALSNKKIDKTTKNTDSVST